MDREISSLQHERVKHWVKLASSSRYREEQGSFLMEGLKPLREVPEGVIKSLIFTDPGLKKGFSAPANYLVTDAILNKITGAATPEGVVAEVAIPEERGLKGVRRVLALDGINDPGNMGTLLRTAVAFGWDAVCLLPRCCDIYNDKVVRAARGAHFKLALFKRTAEELQELANKEGWRPLVADLQGVAPEKVPTNGKLILTLGSEAQGPSLEVCQFSQKITLPMDSRMESLNVAVAGGILMYLLRSS